MGHCCRPGCGWHTPHAVAQQTPPSALAEQTPPAVAQHAPGAAAQQAPPTGVGTVGCQLPDGEATFDSLMSGTMNVNHLQFRIIRV
jgi:hypothetical protein